MEEQGRGIGPILDAAVGTGDLQGQADTDRENGVVVHGEVGDFRVHKLVTAMVLHPTLSGFNDVVVGFIGRIEILGDGAAVVHFFDHPQALGLGSLQSHFLLLLGHGVALGALGEGAGGLVVGDGHLFAVLIGDGDGGQLHQAGDLLGVHAGTGGAFRQVFQSLGGGLLDGEVLIQGNAVDIGSVTVQLHDVVAFLTLEENFHSAQLPVGDVGDVFQVLQAGSADLILVHQSESGDLFLAQTDDVLLITGQAGGGFHVGQGTVAHLFLHVGNVFFLAFVGGILGTGGVIQGAPVGIGEDFLEDLLRLDGGLGGFVVRQPAMEPLQADIGGYKEHQDEHKVQGVEDHAAQTGAFFLLLLGGGRLFLSSGLLLRGSLLGRGFGIYGLGGCFLGCGLSGEELIFGICVRRNGLLSRSLLGGGCGSGLLRGSVLFHRCRFFRGCGLLVGGGLQGGQVLFVQHGLVDIVQDAQVKVQIQVQVSVGLLSGGFREIVLKIEIVFIHGVHLV